MIGRYFENIFNQEFIMKSAAQINIIENKLPYLIKTDEKEGIEIYKRMKDDLILSSILEMNEYFKRNGNINKEQHNQFLFKRQESLLQIPNLSKENMEINDKINNIPEARRGVPFYITEQIDEALISENEQKPDSKIIESQTNLEEEMELKKMIEEEEKLLEEQRFRMLVERSLALYENEELFEFFSLLKRDVKLKEHLCQMKGDQFKRLIEFEENAINYTMKLLNDYEGYTDISSEESCKCLSKKIEGVLLLKFEQELDINLINFLSLLYEIEFFPKWFPFVKTNKLIFQPGKAKKVMYLTANFPFINNRDFCSYGFAVNRTKEERTILVCCRSIDNDKDLFKDHFVESNEKIVRGDIKMFNYEILLKSKNKIRVRSVICIDVKIGFLPQSLIDFGMKEFVQLLFKQISSISKKYEGSEYQNKNPSEIDKKFYEFIKRDANLLFEEDDKMNRMTKRLMD